MAQQSHSSCVGKYVFCDSSNLQHDNDQRHVRCTLKTGRAVSSLAISSRFLTQPLAQATVPSCALPLQRQHPIANMLATAISLLVSSSTLRPSPEQAKQVALPAPMQAPQL